MPDGHHPRWQAHAALPGELLPAALADVALVAEDGTRDVANPAQNVLAASGNVVPASFPTKVHRGAKEVGKHDAQAITVIVESVAGGAKDGRNMKYKLATRRHRDTLPADERVSTSTARLTFDLGRRLTTSSGPASAALLLPTLRSALTAALSSAACAAGQPVCEL